MGKKKRVTLPKNFEELINNGDIEGLKALYEKCELHASYDGRFGKNTALHHANVPEELARWLVGEGLDVNVENYYGRTPLYSHATLGRSSVKLFYDLGGDIEKTDRYGNTPLHTAASFFHSDTVRFLVEKGANIHAKNDMGQTPLASCLSVCGNSNIIEAAKIADIILQAGDKITPDMIERVKHIGQNFEFHRENFHKDSISETDSALKKLYTLFNVEPVKERKIHDGISPIIVKDGSWEEQFEMLWDFLVPSRGPAKTLQGEAIRISGRVHDELYRNGGVNWDRGYRNMLIALLKFFASGNPLSEKELEEAERLVSDIRKKDSDEDFIINRLCQLSVLWVLSNPDPIPLDKVNYTR